MYDIRCISTFNKRELKTTLSGIERANISARNFPLSPDEVRKKLRSAVPLRDGGTTHIFATTILGKKLLIVAEE